MNEILTKKKKKRHQTEETRAHETELVPPRASAEAEYILLASLLPCSPLLILSSPGLFTPNPSTVKPFKRPSHSSQLLPLLFSRHYAGRLQQWQSGGGTGNVMKKNKGESKISRRLHQCFMNFHLGWESLLTAIDRSGRCCAPGGWWESPPWEGRAQGGGV